MSKPMVDDTCAVCEAILDYLVGCQDLTPGEYFGSFWSEKAYHGPLLDYHAGGSHHHRGAGSAAQGLWMVGKRRQDDELMRRAELAFDCLAARQRPGGGKVLEYLEPNGTSASHLVRIIEWMK